MWLRARFSGATLLLGLHGLLTSSFFFFARERRSPLESHVGAKTAVEAVNAFLRKEAE